MPPAARVSDPTAHGAPLAPGPGSTNVMIGYMPAWRAIIDQHACPLVSVSGADGIGSVVMGSPTVFINNMMASRMGDIVVEKPGLAAGPMDPIVMGCPTVIIGDVGMGGAGSPIGSAMAAAKNAGASYVVPGNVLGDEERSSSNQLDWVGIRLVNEKGQDISGEELQGQTTDGQQQQTNVSSGHRFSQIPSGSCQFSFPKFYDDMDKWEPSDD